MGDVREVGGDTGGVEADGAITRHRNPAPGALDSAIAGYIIGTPGMVVVNLGGAIMRWTHTAVALMVVAVAALAVESTQAAGRGGGGSHGGGWHGGGGRGGGWHGGGSHGRSWHGGSHRHGGWHGPRVGVFVGAPFYWPSYYYGYPYYSYPYAYPYAYEAQPSYPPVYVEQEPSAQQAQPPGVWYYCASSNAYYPYVRQCPESWQQVPAQPPS